jgi:hypothetical protein
MDMPLVSAISGGSPIASIAPRDPRDLRDLRVVGRISAPRERTGRTQDRSDQGRQEADATTTDTADSVASKGASETGAARRLGPKQLKPVDQRLVEQLADIDRKVRAHEAAHQAAAGGLGGSATFTYKTGPDGKAYAVGGEVPIDMSPGRTPEETVARAQQIRAAALAPADPSPQDLAVAAQATQMEASAQEQISADLNLDLHEKAMHAADAPRLGPPPDGTTSAPLPSQRESAGSTASSSPGQPGPASRSTRAAQQASAQRSIDVGEQVASTLARIIADRAAAGSSAARLQRLARLAAIAYSM